jgi:hypothetical protein
MQSAGSPGLLDLSPKVNHQGYPLRLTFKVIHPNVTTDLARHLGYTEQEVNEWLSELMSAGLMELASEWAIRCPRVAKAEEIRQKRAKGGVLGGNPSLMKPVEEAAEPTSVYMAEPEKVNLEGYPFIDDNRNDAKPEESDERQPVDGHEPDTDVQNPIMDVQNPVIDVESTGERMSEAEGYPLRLTFEDNLSEDSLPPLSPPLVPPLPPPSHSPLLSPPIIPPTIPPNPESRTAKKNPQESEGHAESKRRLIAMVEGKNPEELMGLIAQKQLHPLQARIIIDGLENIIRRIPKFLTVEEAEKLCSKHPQELLIQMAHELDNYLENHPQRRPYTSLRATLDNWCSRRTSEFTRYRTAK